MHLIKLEVNDLVKDTQDENYSKQLKATINLKAVNTWNMYGEVVTLAQAKKHQKVIDNNLDDLNDFLLEVFKSLVDNIEIELDKAVIAWLKQKGF